MDKIATENLFLLEFLVDNVNLDPKCDCAAGEGERCVSFQFLDNGPLDVCEDDFTPGTKQQQDSVKCGKSCLFSLSPQQAEAALQKFDIYVTIFKRMPEGWLPERVECGEALICIANLFTELINSVGSSDSATPTAKTLKDCFVINNSKGEVIGKLGVYVRMSCFGKLIVTQFQMNLEDKSVLFKDKEGKSLYRYKKAAKGGKRGEKGKKECTPRPICGGQIQFPTVPPRPPCPVQPCIMMQPPGAGIPGCPYPTTPAVFDPELMRQCEQPNPQAKPPCQECAMMPDALCVQSQMNQMEMDQSGQVNTLVKAPCRECGLMPNAPCIQAPTQQIGMGQNIPFTPPGTTPCQECGVIPNAPCIKAQSKQIGMNQYGQSMPPVTTPCQECGAIPNAPCIPRQMGMGAGMPPGMAMSMGMGMQMGMGGGVGLPMGMGGGIGLPMGMGAQTPCIECGNIPQPPCLPIQNQCTPPMQPVPSSMPTCGCGQPTSTRTPCTECAGLPNPPCAPPPEVEGNYQEIGATMGGNTLTIRVHKDKIKVEPVDENTAAITDVNDELGCACISGQPGKKQEHTFHMRPGLQQGNQDLPFSFKVGKSGNTGNNVVVNPPVATAPDGTKYTEFSDPNKEVFILRVGKKSEGIDKKQNLELELCTPRGRAL